MMKRHARVVQVGDRNTGRRDFIICIVMLVVWLVSNVDTLATAIYGKSLFAKPIDKVKALVCKVRDAIK